MQASSKNQWLKPAMPGLIVRDPKTAKPLPAEGALTALTDYWRRRLRDHDVIIVTTPEQGV